MYLRCYTYLACLSRVGILTNPAGNNGKALCANNNAALFSSPAKRVNINSSSRDFKHQGKRRFGNRFSM